jgi:hypothetical protein
LVPGQCVTSRLTAWRSSAAFSRTRARFDRSDLAKTMKPT